MAGTAAVFPGQGSEYPGMLTRIRESEITEEIFDSIGRTAGFDLLCAADPASDRALQDPRAAQLAVFGASVCYWRILGRSMEFQCMAGHSLGFYAALHAAGALSLEDCAGLILRVQDAIEAVSGDKPGLMASIIGLKAEAVEDICRKTGEVHVANINSATQIVISGREYAVREAMRAAADEGALNVLELPVAHPLHSPLMDGIEELVRPFVRSLEIREPSIPVMSHIEGTELRAGDIADILSNQLVRKVLWRDTVRAIRTRNISRFVEIGPSDVLSKLVRWIERDAETHSAEELILCRTS